MVERISELSQQGYNDEQMAELLTTEGFHSARSAHVTATCVMKIRLARQWYSPLEQMRRVEEVDGFLTVRGLAKRLSVNGSTVYHFIRKQVIPPEYVTRDLQAGIYLIRNDALLLARLKERVIENKRRNGQLKSVSEGGA